ncbi:MAG: phosphatidylglycerophosphatase A [Deltaproteobacteria bacterium RBG_13_53_10]|nr:MAG: phosphatidylglycerophosphatase A [Deltaproteobacteria bacterium RBG_13_53_10]
MNRLILFLATGFGVGFSPFVPGTMGTLIAIPLYLILSPIPSPVYEWTVIAFFFLACWISDKAQNHWGKKDDQRIVIDEIMGFFTAMMWVPKTFGFVILGFLLFRFFDILKPPPARRLERVRGGYGVVLDDVMAGLYANIVLHILYMIVR